jgi:putative membrane protein
MTLEIVLRYIHFISIFLIVATLFSEYVLLKKIMTRSEVARLAKIDAIYGIAALTLLIAGLTLWLGSYGKPAIYYTKNWIFYSKLTLFLTVGLLSIRPTVFFIKQRKGKQDEAIAIPDSIIWMLKLELIILSIIPMLAGLMSHGIGYFGK